MRKYSRSACTRVQEALTTPTAAFVQTAGRASWWRRAGRGGWGRESRLQPCAIQAVDKALARALLRGRIVFGRISGRVPPAVANRLLLSALTAAIARCTGQGAQSRLDGPPPTSPSPRPPPRLGRTTPGCPRRASARPHCLSWEHGTAAHARLATHCKTHTSEPPHRQSWLCRSGIPNRLLYCKAPT